MEASEPTQKRYQLPAEYQLTEKNKQKEIQKLSQIVERITQINSIKSRVQQLSPNQTLDNEKLEECETPLTEEELEIKAHVQELDDELQKLQEMRIKIQINLEQFS